MIGRHTKWENRAITSVSIEFVQGGQIPFQLSNYFPVFMMNNGKTTLSVTFIFLQHATSQALSSQTLSITTYQR